MKKLTFLFVALVAASAAYAKEVIPVAETVEMAPKLKVESMGAFVDYYNLDADVDVDRTFQPRSRIAVYDTSETENILDSDLDRVEYGITTRLSYGPEWTFNILATSTSIDGLGDVLEDIDGPSGITNDFSSYSSKLQVEAWRHYDNYSIGAKWAHGNNLNDFEFFTTLVGDAWRQDVFSLRGNYHYPLMDGVLCGWADLKYGIINDTLTSLELSVEGAESDPEYYEIEGMPLAYKYGPVTFGYYMKYREFTNFYDTEMTEQQLRLSANLYQNEKMSVYGEYRYGLKMEVKGDLAESYFDDDKVLSSGDRQQFVLGANYLLSENLILNGEISYQILKYDVDLVDDDYTSLDGDFKETKVGVALTYLF